MCPSFRGRRQVKEQLLRHQLHRMDPSLVIKLSTDSLR